MERDSSDASGVPRATTMLLSAALAVTAIAAPAAASTTARSAGSAKTSTIAPLPLFAPDSVWNRPLRADAPVDPASRRLSRALRATVAVDVAARTGPWIMTRSGSTPLYRVPATQPVVRVTLHSGPWAATLQHALAAVPIPADARPAAGPDGHLTVWQPSTDRLWELWHARRRSDGWHADFGGAMQSVSRSAGYYTAASWPGAGTFWGATATSLPAIAGTMRIDELRSGTIPHALALAIPYARPHVWSWPAQRTDGTSRSALAIPEGARFRVDPRLDIDKLGLPPVTRMIAVAAQRYGMIVRDQTAHAVGLYAEDPSPSGSNPYPALFGGKDPIDLLASFPWDHVQLLQMHLKSH